VVQLIQVVVVVDQVKHPERNSGAGGSGIVIIAYPS
jgi:hypothetical protein